MVDPLGKKSNRVGIEISGSHFRAVSVDADDVLSATFTRSVEGPEPRVQQLISFINGLKSELGDFDRIGISVPGLVDPRAKRVAFSAHIPEHSDVDLVRDVQLATGLETIIENDANAAAYGELKLGAGRGSRDLFYVTLGEGVGGAFIFEGEIWRGAAGFAGEFGYVAINSEGTRLEDVASTANIIRRTRSRFHQDNTSSLNNLTEEQITLAAIISAAENEDDFAQMMLKRTGAYVGSGVANVINLLNVEKIVVGGEIMKARHLVLDAIVERAHELSFRPSFESTTIVEGTLGENAAAAGVALLGNLSIDQ
jgi:glucokinase